jgi:hypothetical protein
MITLPIDDLGRSDAFDGQSAQHQMTQLVAERARFDAQKNDIHRAVYRRRLHDEMQRVWGEDDVPQTPVPLTRSFRPLSCLALAGVVGCLELLLIGLI